MSEEMRTVVIQLLAAFMGAGSFAILFQLKRKYLFIAALGGALEWGVFAAHEAHRRGIPGELSCLGFYRALCGAAGAVAAGAGDHFLYLGNYPLGAGKQSLLHDERDCAR